MQHFRARRIRGEVKTSPGRQVSLQNRRECYSILATKQKRVVQYTGYKTVTTTRGHYGDNLRWKGRRGATTGRRKGEVFQGAGQVAVVRLPSDLVLRLTTHHASFKKETPDILLPTVSLFSLPHRFLTLCQFAKCARVHVCKRGRCNIFFRIFRLLCRPNVQI